MKLLVIDTADVVMKRKSDGHVFVTAEAQLASISASLGINEKVYGSIGNKPLAVIKGQKEVTSTLRNAMYDAELLSLTQGVSIEKDGTATVYKIEKGLKVVDNAGVLEVTIKGNPVAVGGATEMHLRNVEGEMVEATIADTDKTVIVPTGFAKENDLISATYHETVTGDILELDGEKFSEAFEVTYSTIAYDPNTNKVIKDIYIQLDHVVPQDSFEMSLENGNAIAPEITFDCLTAPNSTAIGRIIEVDRATP